MPTGDVGDVGDVGDGDDTAGATGFDGFEFLVLPDSGDSLGFEGEEFGRTFEEEGRGVGTGWLAPVVGVENCEGWSPIVLFDRWTLLFPFRRIVRVERWPQSKAKCPIKAMERGRAANSKVGKTVTESSFLFSVRSFVRRSRSVVS